MTSLDQFIPPRSSWTIMSHCNQLDVINGIQVEPKAEVVTQVSLLGPCQFPISTATSGAVEDTRMKQVEVCVNLELVSEAMKHRVSTFQWVQTAWAILLRCYIANDSVSFGVLPIRQDDILVNRQLWLSKFVETSEVMACQLQLSAEDSVLATMQWVSLSKYARRDFEANNINTALTLPLSFPSRHRHQDINHYLQHLRREPAPDVCSSFQLSRSSTVIGVRYFRGFTNSYQLSFFLTLQDIVRYHYKHHRRRLCARSNPQLSLPENIY
jgi:hypothetical protein